MGAKRRYSGAAAAAILWTAGLLVIQRLPLGPKAAQWRLTAIFVIAWLLGLTIPWLWFRGRGGVRTEDLKARRVADIVDPITGLPGRSSFREIVQKQMNSCGKDKEKGLIVLIGVRDLDRIAESYGDDEAEKVMVLVARALLDSLRGADIVGRHDKDEIAAFLPKATSLCWETIAERIQLNVASQNNQFEKPYIISVNTGHCEFDPASPSPMEILLRRAYEEMIRDMGKDQE